MNLIRYFKPYKWQLLVLLCFTYLQVMANLQLPDYMAKIVNDGIIAGNNEAIYQNGSWMLLIALAGAACAVAVGYLASKVATGFARDIRISVFSRIESFSVAEFDKFSTASLITRTTNDIQQLQGATLMTLRMVLMAPLMAVGALQKAIENAPSLSWVIAVSTGIMLLIILFLFKFAIPKFKLMQKFVDRLNLVTRENLTGLRVIRAFNKEKSEETKFEKANLDITKLNLFVNRLMVVMQPVMMLIMNLSIVAIVWYGAHLISDGSLGIGNMMAFMQYTAQVIMSFLMISVIFIILPRAFVSAKRVAEVINTKPSITDPKNPIKLTKNRKGIVEFKDVTFTYPNADLPVLTNINFVAESGQTTAIIGSTGSGKSTLLNLIARFYDVSAGQILIDGVDIRKLKLNDLYSQIGYIPQKGVLFSGTVKSNISYGNDNATDELIKKVATTAQAIEFIDNLENKYDSNIAQGGSNISGGQKQRLAIARALAVNANILIFDDSFSALDFKTDAKLRHALEKETRNKTVIIVGQRINTILNADKIIVLNEGKIVGIGKHEELLETNKIYQEIATSQLSDNELKNISVKNGLKR